MQIHRFICINAIQNKKQKPKLHNKKKTEREANSQFNVIIVFDVITCITYTESIKRTSKNMTVQYTCNLFIY